MLNHYNVFKTRKLQTWFKISSYKNKNKTAIFYTLLMNLLFIKIEIVYRI